jgi:hypothetical protein
MTFRLLLLMGVVCGLVGCSGSASFVDDGGAGANKDPSVSSEESLASSELSDADEGYSTRPVNIAGANLHGFECHAVANDARSHSSVGCVPTDENRNPIAIDGQQIQVFGSGDTLGYDLFRFAVESLAGSVPVFYGRVPVEVVTLSFEVPIGGEKGKAWFRSSFHLPGQMEALRMDSAPWSVFENYLRTGEPVTGSVAVAVAMEPVEIGVGHGKVEGSIIRPAGDDSGSLIQVDEVSSTISSRGGIRTALVPVLENPVQGLTQEEKESLCSTLPKTEVIHTFRFSGRSSGTCNWDPSPSRWAYAGYVSEDEIVSVDTSRVLCTVKVSFDQDEFEAEDVFVLTLGDVVLAGNQVVIAGPSGTSSLGAPSVSSSSSVDRHSYVMDEATGLVRFDWAVIQGYSFTSPEGFENSAAYCL